MPLDGYLNCVAFHHIYAFRECFFFNRKKNPRVLSMGQGYSKSKPKIERERPIVSVLSPSQIPNILFYPHSPAAPTAAMASITLLSLAPTATFLHIPASSSSSSSLVAVPGILTGRRGAPRALPLRARPQRRVTVVCSGAAAEASDAAAPAEKFRLDNLGPQKGSRRRPKRKGRGISAGQGASCGFGMRGQKSRSGPGVRRGFEGGQMPLYRRIPKLRGIAGGELLLFKLPLIGPIETVL